MEEKRRQQDSAAGSSRDTSSASLIMAMLAHRVPLTLLPDLAMAGRGSAVEPVEPAEEVTEMTAETPSEPVGMHTREVARLAARAETHRRRTETGAIPIVGTRQSPSRRGRHAGAAATEAEESTHRPPSGRHRGRAGARHAKSDARPRSHRAASPMQAAAAESAQVG